MKVSSKEQQVLGHQKLKLAEIGAELKRIREEQNVSLQKIKQITLISERHLKAIENGDISSLPEPVYVQSFIRKYALGDPLVPYAERVDKAIKQVLASRSWTDIQRTWLKRIAEQMKIEIIIDRTTLDEGAFKDHGGFKRLNAMFNGQVESILTDLNDKLWEQTG